MTADAVSVTLASRFAAYEERSSQPTPKYQRVYDVIMEMVEEGELKPGDKVPPETDLAQILPISLGTVQKAIAKLTEQNILQRSRRRGTFVTDHNTELRDLWHFRFVGEDGRQILPVYTSAISVEPVTIDNLCAEASGCTSFIRITRRIDLNHEFGAIGQFYVMAEPYAELLDEPLSFFDGVHLRDILKERYGVATMKAVMRVACETLPPDVCAWLDLSPGAAGLASQIVGFDQQDRFVSVQNVFVPPNVRPLEINVAHPRGAVENDFGSK